MWEELKEMACHANLELYNSELVILTWGNVSVLDKNREVLAIKPSGLSYESMEPDDMVIVDLKSGKVVEGDLRPSSDTATHLELFRAWSNVFSIVHTHSALATAFCQAGRDIPVFGTTHADVFNGPIPLSRPLTAEEIADNYEAATGKVIVETFQQKKLNPLEMPAVLCQYHAPFTWGTDAEHAVAAAFTLEAVARMAFDTITLNPQAAVIPKHYLDKHYSRKHGKNAYYGQK